MEMVNELLKHYEIPEDDLLEFKTLKTVNMLVDFMREDNKELLGSMFTATTFEKVKEFQGRYKQNERMISLIEALKGVSVNE